jgi:hypothetical protein
VPDDPSTAAPGATLPALNDEIVMILAGKARYVTWPFLAITLSYLRITQLDRPLSPRGGAAPGQWPAERNMSRYRRWWGDVTVMQWIAESCLTARHGTRNAHGKEACP